MKKNLLLATLSLLSTFIFAFTQTGNAQATTRISIANGSWTNPVIWSPVGIPNPADDSIIVNTDVTYNVRIVDGQSMFRVNAGASLTDLGNDSIILGADRFVNKGYISCYNFIPGTNDSAVNYGILYVAHDFEQGAYFSNTSTGQICIGNLLVTGDDFRNNGSISTYNWTNGGPVYGYQGKFCIANHFFNGDNISGTLDLCDATPGQMQDINAGNISGNITYCANGPCGMCPTPNGIADNSSGESMVTVFPNPFSATTQIQINPALLHSGFNLVFEMYDVNGNVVRTENVTNPNIVINRENISDGIYFYRLTLNGNAISSGKIIAQ